MTHKQQTILNVALKLFAKQGYTSTPTSLIAKKAKVSEGLIFKHFGSKKGLLASLLEEQKLILNDVLPKLNPHNPKMFMLELIDLVSNLKTDSDLALTWTMELKITTEVGQPNSSIKDIIFLPLQDYFNALRYKYPEEEAVLFLVIMDQLIYDVHLNKSIEKDHFLQFIRFKYGL